MLVAADSVKQQAADQKMQELIAAEEKSQLRKESKRKKKVMHSHCVCLAMQKVVLSTPLASACKLFVLIACVSVCVTEGCKADQGQTAGHRAAAGAPRSSAGREGC